MAFNYVRKIKASNGSYYLFRDIERSIPTVTTVPSSSFGTYTNEDGQTSTFVPGDICRKVNANEETGYDFWMLLNVSNGVYTWDKQLIRKVKTNTAAATTLALTSALNGEYVEDEDPNVTYSDIEAQWSVDSVVVPASGGTATCPSIVYSQTKTTKNDDGTTTVETITSGADVIYWTDYSDDEYDPSMLTVEVESRGAIGSSVEQIDAFYAYVELNGKGASLVMPIIQDANAVTGIVDPEIRPTTYETSVGADGNGSSQVIVNGYGKRVWASGAVDSTRVECDLVVTGVSSSNENVFTASLNGNVVSIDPVGKNYSLTDDLTSDINIYGHLSYNGMNETECPAAKVVATQRKDFVISDVYYDIEADGQLEYENNIGKSATVILPTNVPMLRQDRTVTYMSGKVEETQLLLDCTFSVDEDCYFAIVKDTATGEIEVLDNNDARRSFVANMYAENGGKSITLSCTIEQEMGNPYAFVDLGLPTGTRWCCANIGSYTEDGTGELFAFGDVDGHNADYLFTTSNYKNADLVGGFAQGDPSHDAAYMNAGSGHGVPTLEQLEELLDNTDHVHVKNETDDYWELKSRQNDRSIILGAGAIWSNYSTDSAYAKALVIGDTLQIKDKERHSGTSIRGAEI